MADLYAQKDSLSSPKGNISIIVLACVAVVSVSFKPSGVSAREDWAKRSKKVGAGGRGGEGKETPAAEPRHFTERRSPANGRQ